MKKNRVSESDKMGVNCFQAPLQILREGYCEFTQCGVHDITIYCLKLIVYVEKMR